ncbi:hypothetical protein ACTHSI_02090 [Neisseria sp. P0001.S004]|uniref:hypothetical protein n=1 Tax=Neisseria sp. P0001.S005 TaxID=3436649 RepID=UPI003F80083D
MKPRYYLALYKGHRGGSGWRVWCARATDWLTRILTRDQYSLRPSRRRRVRLYFIFRARRRRARQNDAAAR